MIYSNIIIAVFFLIAISVLVSQYWKLKKDFDKWSKIVNDISVLMIDMSKTIVALDKRYKILDKDITDIVKDYMLFKQSMSDFATVVAEGMEFDHRSSSAKVSTKEKVFDFSKKNIKVKPS